MIIWNGSPQYSIADDQGQRFELLIEEEAFREFGGALLIDRKRVTVVGTLLGNEPKRLKVSALYLAPP